MNQHRKKSPVSRRPSATRGQPPRQAAGPSMLLQHIERLIGKVMRFVAPSDAVVSHYFRENPKLGHRERGIIAEAVFAVLRRRTEFAQYAVGGSGSTEHRLALLGLWVTRGPEGIQPYLSGDEAAWLEHIGMIERASLPARVRSNLPEWLFEALVAQYGESFTEALARASIDPAPLDLRVNSLKSDREAVLSALAEAGYKADATPLAPLGIRMVGKPALQTLPLFKDGFVEVQDEGSQLLCHLLAPRRGEMVVDFCAGAGGKTLGLGALMRSSGRLYAFDVSDKRLGNMKPRLARSGLSNVHPVLIDSEQDAKIKRLAGKIDRVLVDAPCSGLGTLRRNPDLKWRQTPQSITELNEKQRAILASAARLVKPGGRLVYATCSVLARENQDIVQGFLAEHPQFELKPANAVLAEQKIPLEMEGDWLTLYPNVHGTDGFFAAVLERRPAAARVDAVTDETSQPGDESEPAQAS
jgi:16S rRNA (cytosine967-C5)-methyltransferase